MIKRCVSVIVFYDEKKRILLQDRRDISKFGEEWGFFGGSIEKDETPEKAIVREVKEELEYSLDNYSFFRRFHSFRPGVEVTLYLFTSPLMDKLKKFNQKEGEGMKLFTIEQAKKLKMVSTDYPVLDALKQTL